MGKAITPSTPIVAEGSRETVKASGYSGSMLPLTHAPLPAVTRDICLLHAFWVARTLVALPEEDVDPFLADALAALPLYCDVPTADTIAYLLSLGSRDRVPG